MSVGRESDGAMLDRRSRILDEKDDPLGLLAALYGVGALFAWLFIWEGGVGEPPWAWVTLDLAVLGPTWILWYVLISRTQGSAATRRQWAYCHAAGIVASLLAVALFCAAVAVVLKEGLLLDFSGGDVAAGGRAPRRSVALLLVWAMPGVLLVGSIAGLVSAVVRLRRITRAARLASGR